MPINHVTLMEITADASDQDVNEMFVKVRELIRQIPGVTSIAVGKIIEESNTNFTHAGVTSIKSPT